MKYKLSKYVVITDFIDDVLENQLVYSTRSGNVIILNKSTIELLKSATLNTIDFELLDKLITSQIIVPEFENEFETIIDEFEISKSDNNVLNMVITPSANCQLGCNYCGQIHNKTNISEDLSDKIYKHISNKLTLNNYSLLDITWYGAEPLMGIKSIKKLSDKFIALSITEKINYSSSMITNGLNLNQKNFNDLVLQMKVTDFQITIDGIKETHDNSRYTKKGKPTFDIILGNIINCVNNPIYEKEKVNITIRVNVHKNNYNDVEKLLELLYNLKIHNKVQMSFAPVHDWGNNSADKEVGLTLEEFSNLEIDWFLKMNELNFKKQNLIPGRIYGTCMTTSNDAELIDAKGEVSYCWEVPYTPDFESNKDLIIGNVSTDENLYKKDTSKHPLRDWYNDIRDKKNNSSNCHSCEFLPVCGGQCPIAWFKDVKACPSFKVNMEDKLILQYLNENDFLTK